MKLQSYLQIFFIIIAAFAPNSGNALEIKSLSIYGISKHFDNNDGAGYNERNLGIAASTNLGLWGAELEIGYFLNSYYDDTYWVSIQKEIQITPRTSVIAEIRHWETASGTYRSRIAQFYPHIRYKFTETKSLNLIVRASGPIVYTRIDF